MDGLEALFSLAEEGRCMACGAALDAKFRCPECGECWGREKWTPDEERALLKKLGRTE